MAERMKSSLGQAVIVEDVTGAGGTIAFSRVARAAPDGYTLSLGSNGSHVVTGATYVLHYDLLNDFEPVALLSTGPFVLVARKTMPANDLRGLIAWLKANPDKATLGHGGTGSIAHITGVFLQSETGTRFQFVPYRGAAPAIQGLVAGQIDLAISDPRSGGQLLRRLVSRPNEIEVRVDAVEKVRSVIPLQQSPQLLVLWKIGVVLPQGRDTAFTNPSLPPDCQGDLGRTQIGSCAALAAQARPHARGWHARHRYSWRHDHGWHRQGRI
jgi:hypothetical protein